MNVDITVRHFEASDRIKQYAVDEVARIEKYHDRINNVSIVLDRTKEGDKAEINLHISGKDFNASEVSGDFIKSIDLVVDKMATQIKKYVDKRFHR